MRAFTLEDLDTINTWITGHGGGALQPAQVMMKGFIVDDVAVGFLMETNSGVAFIEHWVSNPDATPRQIYKAFDEIAVASLDLARSLGYAHCGSYTLIPSVARMAKRHMGRVVADNYTLLAVQL